MGTLAGSLHVAVPDAVPVGKPDKPDKPGLNRVCGTFSRTLIILKEAMTQEAPCEGA